MHVILEALGAHVPGGGRSASLNLMQGLVDLGTGDRYTLLVSEFEHLTGDCRMVRQIRIPPAGRLLDRLRAQIVLPRLAAELKADLVHHTKNLCCAFLPCPYVVTVYDLTLFAHPDLFPLIDVVYWRTWQRVSLRNAARVIAISKATAADIRRHYHLRDDKVAVIYPGYSPLYDQPSPSDTDAVLGRYGIREEYLLHVGSISRKKNLLTLIRAFAALRAQGKFNGLLVLVGREYGKGKERLLAKTIAELGLDAYVVQTGPVPESDLRRLYAGARVCVFPSLHEGFGLVPVEAMASGVPVVASACEAVREVVGDAGILVGDVENHLALAEGVAKALEHEVREALVLAGRARARGFSRTVCAAQTRDVYREVAGRAGLTV